MFYENTTAREGPIHWILSPRKEDCNSLGRASKEEREICTFDRGEKAEEKGGSEKGSVRRECWLEQGTVKADRRERNWPTEEDREAGSL